MNKRKPEKLEPLPRTTFIVVGLMAVVLIGLALAGGKYYLGNWRGDMLFLPVALFLATLDCSCIGSFLQKELNLASNQHKSLTPGLSRNRKSGSQYPLRR